MKVNMTPRLPVATKTFASYSSEERALWDLLLMLKEDKDCIPAAMTRSPEIIEAVLGYKRMRDEIAAMEKAKARFGAVLYEALVSFHVGRLETPVGSVTMTAYTREEYDKDYLKEVAPEAFTTVPDRLQIGVK